MDLPEVLEKIGLNDKQARVYLALLELGAASVQSIAAKAGVKRPTCYLILDDLLNKGLASAVPRSRKVLYSAESPEYLIADLVRKEELMKRMLPELLAIHNARKEKPDVLLFSGPEGVKQIYRQIFDTAAVDFFGTVRDVSKIYPEGLKEFVRRIKDRRLTVRDLLAGTEEESEYIREARSGANYQIRILPAGMSFSTDSALFADRVVFFSFRPQVFAVMIKSREIYQSILSLYNLAWNSAQPLSK